MERFSSNISKAIESNSSPKLIKESTAEILEPPGKKVFYNPVQEFNRDLSVLVLQIFSKQFLKENASSTNGKSFKILEALSATGLRSVRYAKEIPNVTEVIANDFSSEAVKNIEINIKHNNVENIVKPSFHNAVLVLSNAFSAYNENRFHAIDIDPYGSPAQFLDTAVQCVANGGMLLVTCTDVSVLCGVYPETCYAKYGAVPLKTHGKHEMALRILLQSIQSHASKYKRFIVPLLSVSVDFYIRVFVKVYTSALACKAIFSKLSMMYECCGCGANIFKPLGNVNKNGKKLQYSVPQFTGVSNNCTHCGGTQKMGGPIWTDPIHDYKFVDEVIKSNEINEFATSKRLLGMLTLVREELHDIPLYYSVSCLSKAVKCVQMPMLTLRSAILNAGYRVSTSHASKDSLKTDAPMTFLWDVFRAWVHENPINVKNVLPGSPTDRILNTPIQNKIDFTEREDANPVSRKMGLLRYQINPAPYWGPGVKSTTMTLGESITSTNLKKKGTFEAENLAHKKQKTEDNKLNNEYI